MNRRQFLKFAGVGAMSLTVPYSAAFAAAEESGPQPDKPNIIFILADDLGYADLGCYGQKRIKTPNLDRMAADGVRFTQHYAASTVCAPSRCCLMTGLHTGRARIRANGVGPLQPDDVTVAELLKRAGYTTGLIGKWGLGREGSTGVPNKQGFDYFFGYLRQVHAHNYYPAWLWRNDKKVHLKNEVKLAESGYAKGIGGAATKRVEYSNDLFTEEAFEFIEKNKARPFFLYLAYTIPHANNEAHLVGRHGMEVPDYGIYKDKDWPEPQKGHAAMITRLDEYVGRLLEKLAEHGLDEKTVVFFSSDNGPHREGGARPEFFDSNGQLRGIKRDLYEGGIRVPLIVRGPVTVRSGAVSEHISAFWDFMPTCAQLVGEKVPDEMDGISYAAELSGKSQPQHKYLYWEFYEQGGKQAVRMGDWKGVRLDVKKNPDGPVELYNLKADIGEKRNTASEHPAIVHEIERVMTTAHKQTQKYRLRAKANQDSD